MTKISLKFTPKKIISVLLLTAIFVSVGTQVSNQTNFSAQLESINKISESPHVSVDEWENPIIGTGDNRTHRLFLENSSSTTGTNYFNITSESNEEYLHDGDFDLILSKSYNTTYTLEEDSPLQVPKLPYTPDTDNTEGLVSHGNIIGGNNASLQTSGNDDVSIDSQVLNGDNAIIMNATTDFAGVESDISSLPAFSPLADNSSILGFDLRLDYQVDEGVMVSVLCHDSIDNDWDIVDSFNLSQTGGGYETKHFYIPNANLRYLNDNQNPIFSLVFTNTTATFQLDIDYVRITGIAGHEHQIVQNEPVAMEFDLKGEATVYGFQMYIRSLNIEADETSNLTIGLYHSNITTPVTRTRLLDPQETEFPLYAEPNISTGLIAENSFENFTGDGFVWLNLHDDYSGEELDIGNYFVVISSNLTDGDEKSISIVSIPYGFVSVDGIDLTDGEGNPEHLLLTNSTTGWERVNIDFDYVYRDRVRESDAAGFSVNLTRAYRPSEIDLTIDDQLVSDSYKLDYPYVEGHYWWGYGELDLTFTDPIPAEFDNFQVNIDWDKDIYNGDLDMDVTYNVTKYFDVESETKFELNIDESPKWNVSYLFNPSEDVYDNWNLTKMSYYVPGDWVITALLNPAQEDVLKNTTSTMDENQKVYTITGDLVNNTLGNFILQATSTNYMEACEFNLHYGDKYWPTNGFMLEDNIHAKVGVLVQNKFVKKAARATLQIFNPDGNLMAGKIIHDTTVDVNDTYSWYEFDQDLYSNVDMEGKFTVIANWSNGEEVGLMKKEIYVNHYAADIVDVQYNPANEINRLFGTIAPFETDLQNYNLYIYGVKNWTDSIPAEIPINRTMNKLIQDDVYLVQYTLNETVLNPGEDVKVQVLMENRHTTLDFDIEVKSQLIMYQNNEWVMVESSEISNIDILGSENNANQHLYELILSIPDITAGGENAPLREAPMLINLKISIESEEVYNKPESDKLYYTNQPDTDFEGNVVYFKEYNERVGPSFIGSLSRTDLALPDDVHYFMQVSNDYLQTSVQSVNYSQYYEIDTEIVKFKVEQGSYSHTSVVNFTGQLLDEYNVPIAGETVEFKYDNTPTQDTTTWNDLIILTEGDNTIMTDSEGKFNFEVNLTQTPLAPEIKVQSLFGGNSSHLSSALNYTLVFGSYEHDLSISIDDSMTIIEGKYNYINLIITNNGNSTIENWDISMDTELDGKINLLDSESTILLNPGESINAEIEIYDNSISVEEFASITVNVQIKILETGEIINYNRTALFDTYRVNTNNLMNSAVIIGFIAGTALIWIAGAKYIKTKYDEVNAPTSTESDLIKTRRKRRGSKYVQLSEVEKEKKPLSEGEGTSLDDLLEEEEN